MSLAYTPSSSAIGEEITRRWVISFCPNKRPGKKPGPGNGDRGRLLFFFVLAALLTTALTLLAGILLLLALVVVIALTGRALTLLVLLVLLALLVLLVLLILARLILIGAHATSPQMASERCREQTIGSG